jgi:hypothetical protein
VSTTKTYYCFASTSVLVLSPELEELLGGQEPALRAIEVAHAHGRDAQGAFDQPGLDADALLMRPPMLYAVVNAYLDGQCGIEVFFKFRAKEFEKIHHAS